MSGKIARLQYNLALKELASGQEKAGARRLQELADILIAELERAEK